MMDSVPVDGRLPTRIKRGEKASRVLPAGDDVPTLESRIETIRLRVGIPDLQADAAWDWDVTLNGRPLALTQEKPGWLGRGSPGVSGAPRQ